ncbi:MAG TPA: RNA polymerase sigma factor RpoD/SigA [Longimicrobium sp.]|uniref:sigma-70 family RNA polymerase sigma factor n=1 Tax=Longimicrobium sp. TaxID=2029185 RepID=UPI002ED9EF10
MPLARNSGGVRSGPTGPIVGKPLRVSLWGDPESPTSLDLYLKEIGAHPLLTREEEIALARRARAGDASAAEALVTSNLRFVVMIAKKYQNLGLPLSDLIHEGNVGMLYAVPKFDPDHGARFVSYASWWIRQAIYKALGRAMLVRPRGADEVKLRRIRKHAARLAQIHRSEPALADVADAAGVELIEAAHALNLRGEQFRRRGFSTSGELELLPDHKPLPDAETYYVERAERIETTLQTLPTREALVLRLKFGLEEGQPMTQAAIAELLGISAERVRQLVQQALKKLREPSRAVRLEPFI